MLAIVLSRRDWREYDQLVSLYTREEGRREALARGVKKPVSKLSPHLFPWFALEVEIVAGAAIDHLIKAVPVQSFAGVVSDAAKLATVRYATKLLYHLTPEQQADRRVFDLALSLLAFLNAASSVPESVSYGFVFKLLAALGLAPRLDDCVRCGSSTFKSPLLFSVTEGGVAHAHCGGTTVHSTALVQPLSVEGRARLAVLLEESWEKAGSVKLTTIEKRLISQFLAYYSEKKVLLHS